MNCVIYVVFMHQTVRRRRRTAQCVVRFRQPASVQNLILSVPMIASWNSLCQSTYSAFLIAF